MTTWRQKKAVAHPHQFNQCQSYPNLVVTKLDCTKKKGNQHNLVVKLYKTSGPLQQSTFLQLYYMWKIKNLRICGKST